MVKDLRTEAAETPALCPFYFNRLSNWSFMEFLSPTKARPQKYTIYSVKMCILSAIYSITYVGMQAIVECGYVYETVASFHRRRFRLPTALYAADEYISRIGPAEGAKQNAPSLL